MRQTQLLIQSTEQVTEQVTEHDKLVGISDEDVDRVILQERNENLRKLAEDMEHLSEISLSLKELVYEQSEPLDTIEQNLEKTEINVQEASEHLQTAQSYINNLKGIFAKGALVSTGVTGAGAATGIFLNPIAGGIGVVLGVGGIVYCLLKLASS